MNTHRLSAVISFIRHGEKDNQGNLTPKGIQQAIERGLKLRHLKGDIHLYHSGVDRVKKTAQTISNFLNNTVDDLQDLAFKNSMDSYVSGSHSEAGVNQPEEALDELHYVIDRNKPSEYFKAWIPVDKEAAITRAQEYLNYTTKSPEPDTTPSPEQIAKRSIRTLINQINTSLSTSYDVKENFINTTHEPVIMCMLYYLMSDCKPTDKEFVNKIGGSVDFAEGFDVNIYQSDTDAPLIFLDFREFLKVLDLKKLSKFVES